MCASQWVLNKPGGEMKVQAGGGRPHSGSPFPRGRGAPETRRVSLVEVAEFERTRWDPKDGELCPDRTRPEETLVEVRSGSDVQIDRQIWV
ncbi:hypothetical protein JTE90_019908 [Oedothorax gibbosus]|uniref:Uncharacterized protein n=1 Tax=Oedothorax gibbosus TaxID=931172 RepID=A0AAV6TF92_9ARAC|nr:hypothetical protein JTE90_019908 [Oedothorax gibbosus]